MKKLLFSVAAAGLLLASCSKDSQEIGVGKIAINAQVTPDITLKTGIPADNFDLKITANGDASVKYSGKVSAFASPMELPVGTYTVAVESEPFTTPAFDKPVYGATKTDVAIADAQTTTVNLNATQTNAAIAIAYDPAMVSYCTTKGYAYSAVVSSTAGDLSYPNTETRFGYFAPGSVTVKVTMNGKEYTQTFTLTAADKKTVTVNVTPKPVIPTQLSMTISGDDATTARDENWTFDEVAGVTATVKLTENFALCTIGGNTATSGAGSPSAKTLQTETPPIVLANFPTTANTYSAGGTVKVGTSSTIGSIESKTLDLSANSGKVTVRFKVKGWISGTTTTAGTLDVTLGGTTTNVAYSAGTNVTDFQTLEVKFTNGAANQTLKIATKSPVRAFIDDVEIIN